MKRTIDLHTHTTASDGSLDPSELVRAAHEAGLAAVAITDHDTVDGVARALQAGRKLDIEVVAGVELSTDLADRVVHVLGYFVDPDESGLREKLDWARGVRASRNEKIVARFLELGIPMTMKEVAAKAGGDVVGRPHFAQVLVEKGVVKTIQKAFDIYLDRAGKAYIPKFRFQPAESIALIRNAGGLPVLAHPGDYHWRPLALDEQLATLVPMGLAGLEVLYSTHTPSQVQIFLDLARHHDLAPTGGSDFHGDSKPIIRLGRGFGDLSVPYEWLENLQDRLEK